MVGLDGSFTLNYCTVYSRVIICHTQVNSVSAALKPKTLSMRTMLKNSIILRNTSIFIVFPAMSQESNTETVVKLSLAERGRSVSSKGRDTPVCEIKVFCDNGIHSIEISLCSVSQSYSHPCACMWENVVMGLFTMMIVIMMMMTLVTSLINQIM